MNKVCIATAARSEYGLLRWIIDEVHNSDELELQLIVTGGHLSEEQGLTYKAIGNDGYPISAKVDIQVDSTSQIAICKSMAICLEKMSVTLSELKPDVLIVLGDRYELLPICSAALILRVPIAHISGGDITEGAIDNEVRNAVTMMSTYHFPGTKISGERVIRMLGNDKNVYVTGETNVDNFIRIKRLSKQELASQLCIDANKKWVICTYHAETQLSLEENIHRVNNLCKLFREKLKDYEVVITKANADFGGAILNEIFESESKSSQNVHLFSSLGQIRYISMLYSVDFMIGNTSSGIYESPIVKIPCINIGDRQKGRLYLPNIITIDGSYSSMVDAINKIDKKAFADGLKTMMNPYGDGHSSERIVEHIKKLICR